MPNMKSIINKQNTLLLNNSDNKVHAKQCNCIVDQIKIAQRKMLRKLNSLQSLPKNW